MHTFSCAAVEVMMDCERENHLKFSTMHFCYLCLAANLSRESVSRMQYCCTRVQPNTSI